jgi:hypothetical protein
LLGAVAAVSCFASCRDPVRERAERDARDLARLGAIVEADQALDRALKGADDRSRAGEDAKAIEILERDATRAAAEALVEAEREPLETDWAGARREALTAVMRDRQASIAAYAGALRHEDLEPRLDATLAQLRLQRRALDVATWALAPPGQPRPVSPPDAG